MSRAFLVVGALGVASVLVPPRESAAQTAPAWEKSWDAAWARATTYYRITAATTLATHPACQGDLGLSPKVKDLVRAMAAKKYGDATRILGTIQDKSLCLSLEGTRGLEFALAGFLHRAMTELPAADAEIAVHGALNASTIVFDQLQYTRKSWLLPALHYHQAKLAPIVARYPKADMPFYGFDWSRGTLAGTMDPALLLAAVGDFKNFGDGSCTLLEMSGAGYACKGWVGTQGAGGGAGGGKGAGAVGGIPGGSGAAASAVSCIADAARSTGVRGQLACASKAVAGMTFDPKTSAADILSKGFVGTEGSVRDPRCALSADAGGDKGGNTDPEAAKKEPTTWDKIKDVASKAADVAIAVVVSVFDKTPPVVSDLSPLASPEGADAARGAMQMLQAQDARNSLLSDDGYDAYAAKREGRVVTNPQANQRTVDPTGGNGPLGGRGGGACGRGSNAARRAHALYDCMQGGQPQPKPSGPSSPLVAHVDPDQVQSPASGALACMMQGGDLPRGSFTDPKCKMARCAEGALSCTCDRGGGPGGGGILANGVPVPKISATTSPNCAEPPCASLVPKGTGTIAGPRTGPTVPPSIGGPGTPSGPAPVGSVR